MDRAEFVTRGRCPPAGEIAPGVELRVFAAGPLGARGVSTGTATMRPGAVLPYHTHPFSECITVLAGRADVLVQGRRYRMGPFDAIHVPAGTAHTVHHAAGDAPAVLLWSFASAQLTREPAEDVYTVVDRDASTPGDPEHLTRFETATAYELEPGTTVRDLFGGRTGARGLCGGHAVFAPGAALPCHFHAYDEAITIVAGRAVCQVAGRSYELADYDAACVPAGRPHRFVNRTDAPMAMVWVYAGNEPERTVVGPDRCDGD